MTSWLFAPLAIFEKTGTMPSRLACHAAPAVRCARRNVACAAHAKCDAFEVQGDGTDRSDRSAAVEESVGAVTQDAGEEGSVWPLVGAGCRCVRAKIEGRSGC
jgi:hypothetical protein